MMHKPPHSTLTAGRLYRIGILLLSWLVCPTTSTAQGSTEMLIGMIAGNNYTINTTDRRGKEDGWEVVKVGTTRTRAERLELPMDIFSYNEKGRLQDSTRTIYTCTPGERQMVLVLLPFATQRPKSTIRITDVNAPDLYPQKWNGTMALPDRTMSLDIEGGVAGFFGANSKVVYTGRVLTPTGPSSYRITGTLTVSTYAWGINVSNITFRITEVIDLKVGVVRQDLHRTNGAHTTVKLQGNGPDL